MIHQVVNDDVLVHYSFGEFAIARQERVRRLGDGLAYEGFVERVRADQVLQRLHALLGGEVQPGLGQQAVQVPFLVEVGGAVRPYHRVEGRRDHVDGALAEILALHDLDAPGIDHLALLVHHLVVLEDVLAHLGVAGFDVVLGPFDGPGHHAVLDRDVLGEPPHRTGA